MSNILRLKTHRSETEWREIYDEHVSKGISMSSFCKSKGIALSSYIKWYRQFSGVNNKSSKFKELLKERVPAESSRKVEIELDLGSGVMLRILR